MQLEPLHFGSNPKQWHGKICLVVIKLLFIYDRVTYRSPNWLGSVPVAFSLGWSFRLGCTPAHSQIRRWAVRLPSPSFPGLLWGLDWS